MGGMESERNLGGRPPIYEPTEENFNKVADLCTSFFDYIKGEFREDEFEYEKGKFQTRTITIRPAQPPTVTGLTLHLGFDNKSTLYDYAKKEHGFSNPIKRALTKIEQYHEIAVSGGDKCVGNIFVLKNFNWKDSQAIDHTTNGNDLPQTILKIGYGKDDSGD